MFTELMPLIENRPLTITVASFGEGQIRVNVVPQAVETDHKVNDKIAYSNKDKIAEIPKSAIHALTTPLSLTGTPEEIDAELAQQLKAFVDCHATLQECVEQAKQEIAEAVKAIEERDKNRSKARTATATKPEAPSSDNKVEETSSPTDSLPLFEPAAATPQQ